jgi:signal transduction histidine kinase
MFNTINNLSIIEIRGLFLFFITFLNFILALVLYTNKDKPEKTSIIFLALTAFFSGLMAFFSGATYFFWESMPDFRLVWYRSTWLGVFILPNLVGFVFNFFNKTKDSSFKILSWYVIGVIISILSLSTSLFTKEVYLSGNNIIGTAGSLDFIGRIFIFAGTVTGLYYLVKQFFHTRDEKKIQKMKYFVFGLYLYIIGSVVSVGLIPLLTGKSAYYDAVAYFSTIWIIFTAYAILKHKLLDIDFVIKKAFIVSVVISLLSGTMMTVSLLSQWFSARIPGFNYWTIPLTAGFTTYIVGYLFWNKSKEVEKMKYEFITVAAHKTRTPLTKIKWGLELLSKETSEKGKILLSKVSKAVEETIDLTEELLAASQAEADEYLHKPEIFNLDHIVKSVLAEFEEIIKNKKIKLVLNIQRGDSFVKADKMKISSIIRIFLDNAIKYLPADVVDKRLGEIKIRVVKEKNKVLVFIADNGIGVHKEDQHHIFSSLYRTHEACLIDTEGCGVGLYIAKNIIRRHRGKIGVHSKGCCQGSEFWFSLPR